MMIRWGILGAGTIADTRFAPALKRDQNSRLIAVQDPDQIKAEYFAQKHGAKKIHPAAESLCLDEEIDAVYIASPNKYHAEQTILAASNHKHVMCEKPMAMNAREAAQMVRAANENGIVLAIAYMMPFHSSHMTMKRLLDDKVIGDLYLVKSDYLISLPYFQGSSFTVDQFRLQKADGGGVIMDLAPHCINTIGYLMHSEVRSVCAKYDTLRF
jgi:predicted dehydrogenase